MNSPTAAQVVTSVAQRLNGDVVTVTISRPSKLNSLDVSLLELFTKTIQELPQRYPNLMAVVITGEGGKAFVGGADVDEISMVDTPAAARQFITKFHLAFKSIRECPAPVIGRINGYALGAGLAIAASCDFRVASTNAVFGMPEVRIGVPSVVETALIPGLIGWRRTRRLLLLGEDVAAEEALQWGLVEKVVEPALLDRAVDDWLQQLQKNGPVAVRQQKALMLQWERLGLDEGIRAGISVFGESFEGGKNGELTEPSRMTAEFLKMKEIKKDGGGSKI